MQELPGNLVVGTKVEVPILMILRHLVAAAAVAVEQVPLRHVLYVVEVLQVVREEVDRRGGQVILGDICRLAVRVKAVFR